MPPTAPAHRPARAGAAASSLPACSRASATSSPTSATGSGRHRLAARDRASSLALARRRRRLPADRDDGDDDAAGAAPPRRPRRWSSPRSPAPEETEDLGFPTFATKNTTRVAGADPVADAAASRSPSTRRPATSPGPDAVTLVDAGDWQAGVAAASLVADPVGAPLLVTEDGEVPELTEAALRALGPEGSAATAGRQVFVVGAAAEPEGYETLAVEGGDPAELAAEIARLRERLAGEPDAHRRRQRRRARLRDARRRLGGALGRPGPVRRARRASRRRPSRRCAATTGVPVYVLGPESAISERDDEGDRAARPERRAGRRRGPGRERDRLRPLRRRQLRLEHQRPRPRVRDRQHRAAARRRRRRAAVGQRHLGPAAGHRRRRRRCRPRCAATCSTSSPATRTTRPAPSTTTSG